MALFKVMLLLAIVAGVTFAATIEEAQELVNKAMWDGDANEMSPGVPPYSFCGSSMNNGKFIVESVDVTSGADGDLYTLKVTKHLDGDANHNAVNEAGKPLQLLKNGDKLTIKINPCSGH